MTATKTRLVEPVTLTIVAAVVAGATAETTKIANEEIRASFRRLKQLLHGRYEGAEPLVQAIEADPTSRSTPHVQRLARLLSTDRAEDDRSLRTVSAEVLEAVDRLRDIPEAAALFDFENVVAAANIELEDIVTAGPLIKASHTRFEGDIKAKRIRATATEGREQKE